MITLSLCMIVRDEEKTLPRCLESVKDVFDEIIIVDTGSVDHTKSEALKYTDNIHDFAWVDDFSKARNYSFSKATKDYIMWMDADDVLLEKDRLGMLQLKQVLPESVDTVILRYDLESQEEHKVVSSFYRERIVKRSKGFQWYDPVHEYIAFTGTYTKQDIAVTHKKITRPTRRNLEIMEKYVQSGHKLSERNWFYYARELYNFREFDRAIEYYDKFWTTTDGLMSNYLDCCMDLAICYTYKKDYDMRLKSLLRYFEKFGPRAEICCAIGSHYKELEDYEQAICWYRIAPHTVKPVDTLGCVSPLYWDYIPCMELCACYYKLGKIDEAIKSNEMIARLYPTDEKICHNRVYLASVKNASSQSR